MNSKSISRTITSYTAKAYMTIFNWISRIFFHCTVNEDITARRWEISNNKALINDLVKEVDADIKVEYAFQPKGSTEIGMYILFGNYTGLFYRKGLFADDRPYFIMALPFFMISDEEVENGQELVYKRMTEMFAAIFKTTMDITDDVANKFGDFHARLLFERNDKSEYESVNKALNIDVLSTSKCYPALESEEAYKTAMHIIVDTTSGR